VAWRPKVWKAFNNENRNLYISTVLIDSSGNLIVLFPLDWDDPEEAALVPPGKILAFPNAEDKFERTPSKSNDYGWGFMR
jgi:hypothetical protein